MLSHASQVSPSFVHDAPLRSCFPSSSPRRRLRALASALALAGLLCCLAASAAGADSVPTSCDKFASPQGSDAASGSATAPFRTAGVLASSLSAGQVGCLRAGTYAGGLRVGHGGAAGAPIVLRSYPGEQALITGRVYVPRGSNYVTIGDLSLDGNFQSPSERLPSPTVNANHVTFEADDVTDDHTGICFDIGSATWGFADSTVIAGNRIHDCGVIPATNQQHGIYVQDATNTQIVGNTIVSNADRGIQLYPNSTGAVITGNVIASNGEGIIFSGEGSSTSSGNLVEHNLVVNSLIRHDVESWYPSGTPLGVGNLVQNNCVSASGIDTSSGGFTAQSNVTASAGELLPTGGGAYAPASGSACAAVLGAAVSAVEATPSAGAPTPAGKGAGPGATPHGHQTAATAASAPATTTSSTPGARKPAAKVAKPASRARGAHRRHAHRSRHRHAKHRLAAKHR